MNDPHVVTLTYRLDYREDVEYEGPPVVAGDRDGFSFRLQDDVLTCEMHDHFATVREARVHVAPMLQAWEISAALEGRRGEIGFAYQSAEIVDRDPQPGVLAPLQASGTGVVTEGGDVALGVSRQRYPAPPLNFVASPDVCVLWARMEGYLDGREPLLAMAYFCLTVLEARAGGRKEAARVFRIEEALLGKVGELTSTRGDAATARKMQPELKRQPLSPDEARWLEGAIKAVVVQVGRRDAGAQLTELSVKSVAP